MNDKLAKFKNTLQTFDDVLERMKFTEEIKNNLIEVKVGNWRNLHRCNIDGSYWIEEYPFSEQHGGGSTCFYCIEVGDPFAYLDNGPYLTSKLREKQEHMQFWTALGDEVGPQACKAGCCDAKRIRHSVFCKRHHYESITQLPCPY